MIDLLNQELRENRYAILPFLIVEIVTKGKVHASHLGQLGDLVDALRSSHTAIHFLQTDQIRALLQDDVRDSLQVQFLSTPTPVEY